MISITKNKLFFYSFLLFSYLYLFSGEAAFQLPKGCSGAASDYQSLTEDTNNPFVMSVGTSMSQTHVTDNTVSPKFVRKKLHEIARKKGKEEAKSWLKAENRYWYLLRSMPHFGCSNKHQIDPAMISEPQIINKILDDIVNNLDEKELVVTKCPICDTDRIGIIKEETDLFTLEMEDKLVNLIKDLRVNTQSLNGLPNVRLSIEIADILKKGSTEIDKDKLNRLIRFIDKLGNPMLFFHHYANPEVMPNLFEDDMHITWFAKVCADIIKHLPNITHVCPVSQPTGFAFRVTREDLPPFEYSKKRDVILENILKASAQACEEMKKVRKDQKGKELKVLVSHQWKIMKQKHTNVLDPRYGLESLVTTIADSMYNQTFVKAVTPYLDVFDGIALSVYPALYFDMWKPEGSNVAGKVDYQGSIEAVQQTSKAFPGKDIYIVEAGCNTADANTKRNYIDMMMCVCKQARKGKIPVKGLYFWGITNHPDFYMEWNSAKGSTNFGPYDSMELSSINESGKYMKEISSPVFSL